MRAFTFYIGTLRASSRSRKFGVVSLDKLYFESNIQYLFIL